MKRTDTSKLAAGVLGGMRRCAGIVVMSSLMVAAAAVASAAPLFTSEYDTTLPSPVGDVIGLQPMGSTVHVFTTHTFYTSPAFDGASLSFEASINVPFPTMSIWLTPMGEVAFDPDAPGFVYMTGLRGFAGPGLYHYRLYPEAYSVVSIQGASSFNEPSAAWSPALDTIVLAGLNGSTQQIWPIDLATGAAGPGFGTTGPGTLTTAGALATGPDDRIYVIDTTMSGKRVVGFDPDGTYHHEFPLVGTVATSALVISPDSRLYTANGNGGGDVYDLANGMHLGSFESSAANPTAGKALLRFDDGGYLYLFDPATGLHVFDPPMDRDADGIDDDADNCLLDANADQSNTDATLPGGDLLGDACDDDDDADTVLDEDDLCAASDDTEDADADLTPDGCDACNNAGAQNLNVKPSLAIKKTGTDATAGDESLSIKGSFVLPSTFASLDPATDGIRVVILTDDGSLVADVTVPGGAEWSSPNEKKHQFLDKTGANNGITKVQLADQSSKAPSQVGIKLTAKNGAYPVAAGNEPLHATIVIGDGSLGECTETVFASGACEFNGAGNSVKCK